MASERESIMDLIRNEYDPKPNLGRGDFPAFEWDDGAGRIADAILADQTLALRKLVDERDALIKALQATQGRIMNARIDLQTGHSKAAVAQTLDGIIKFADAALAKVKP